MSLLSLRNTSHTTHKKCGEMTQPSLSMDRQLISTYYGNATI